ncbi:hypothetical protein DOW24_00845 [Salmonella enterica subsp. enterica serovar Nigeria]|nr:hypothetical protein [Salmonella enterica subsp. enterica]EBC9934444.1 hypothetical protein [Salmonella enterica subsp. enterica serovar Nigeria]EBQ4228035.1 hypothetical protein [Salmonella enterica]EHL9702505.1 hypothetical protein [Salmonella enterica subsp. enterica serovar Infantis]EIR7537159.1 hypothetical protein [Salmonella enterica subsp. enterica serovar Durham]
MIERGMIFNGEMVRAILDGRKTQTRRIMKVQPAAPEFGLRRIIESSRANENGMYFWSQYDASGIKARSKLFSCPHGDVGDRIWVRETWAEAGASAPELKLYRANYPDHVPSHYENVPPVGEIRWTPSIHMPRWASRITLEITDVRVERVRDITEDDAQAEGGPTECTLIGDKYFPGFRSLWKSIYGEESWAANSWVWVIEFKRVEGGAA